MARSDDPDSASSQFFICHGDASESLDDKYAGFGYVVYGMDTVDVIAGLETDDSDKPTVKVTIESATFLKKKA
jgi:peptidyl-prolyl cis-trans isomerase B (cyclophilin B)